MEIPEARLDHLLRLTDRTGLLEHAVGIVPAYREGYTTDDNARALRVALAFWVLRRDPRALEAAVRYAAFLLHGQREDGWFHNELSYDRRWEDEQGPEDATARALAAAGYAVRLLQRPEAQAVEGLLPSMLRLWERARNVVLRLSAPRPVAYALEGLVHLAATGQAPPAGARQASQGHEAAAGARAVFPGIHEVARELASRLLSRYRTQRREDGDIEASGPGWEWFEPVITYDNARIPLALLLASSLWPDGFGQACRQAGLRTLSFLWQGQWDGQRVVLVGNRGWWRRGGGPARWDQQPIDAGAQAEAWLAAWQLTGEAEHLERARLSLEWFTGRNLAGLPLVDNRTGGCRDGIGPNGLNPNQGAESTLAWLSARLAFEEAGISLAVLSSSSRRIWSLSRPSQNGLEGVPL